MPVDLGRCVGEGRHAASVWRRVGQIGAGRRRSRAAAAGPRTSSQSSPRSTSAPIRPSTSTNPRSPCSEADPRPGTVTRPPVIAAAAKKYEAADASGSIAYGRPVAARHDDVAPAGDVGAERRASPRSSCRRRDATPTPPPTLDRRARRQHGAASSRPERNWLDTSPSMATAAARPAVRLDDDREMPGVALFDDRTPSVAQRVDAGRPSAAPRSCGSPSSRKRPWPTASIGSKNRAVVPDCRASRSASVAGISPSVAVHDDDLGVAVDVELARRGAQAVEHRLGVVGEQHAAKRARPVGRARRRTSARFVMLFEPGTGCRRRAAPTSGWIAARVAAHPRRCTDGR